MMKLKFYVFCLFLFPLLASSTGHPGLTVGRVCALNKGAFVVDNIPNLNPPSPNCMEGAILNLAHEKSKDMSALADAVMSLHDMKALRVLPHETHLLEKLIEFIKMKQGNFAFHHLHVLDLRDVSHIDQILPLLRPLMPRLQGLNVSGSKMTLREVVAISQLSGLKTLDMSHTESSESGISELSVKMKPLENLNISHNKIGNQGLFAMGERMQKTLKYLNVSNTHVTKDADPIALEGLINNLVYLDISGNSLHKKFEKKLLEEARKRKAENPSAPRIFVVVM